MKQEARFQYFPLNFYEILTLEFHLSLVKSLRETWGDLTYLYKVSFEIIVIRNGEKHFL